MAYRVELTLRAERDVEYLYRRSATADAAAAARWFNGLEQAIYTLEGFPRRCPVAPESKKAKRPLRHLVYCRRKLQRREELGAPARSHLGRVRPQSSRMRRA
jgi:plasmid stabilization system protein ParE